MEIDPEVLPPERPRDEEPFERVRVTYYRPGPLATILFSILALAAGVVMLFVIFWLGLIFTALGLIALAAQWLLRKFQ